MWRPAVLRARSESGVTAGSAVAAFQVLVRGKGAGVCEKVRGRGRPDWEAADMGWGAIGVDAYMLLIRGGVDRMDAADSSEVATGPEDEAKSANGFGAPVDGGGADVLSSTSRRHDPENALEALDVYDGCSDHDAALCDLVKPCSSHDDGCA